MAAEEPIDWRELTVRLRPTTTIYERLRGKLVVLTQRKRKGAPKFSQEQIEFMGRDFFEMRLAEYYANEGDLVIAPSLAALARATYLGKKYAAASNEIKDVRQTMAIALAQAGEPLIDICVATGVNLKNLREAWFVGDMPTGDMKVSNQKQLDEDTTGEVKPVLEPVMEKSLLVPVKVMEELMTFEPKDLKERAKTFHPLPPEDVTASDEEEDDALSDELDDLGEDAVEDGAPLAATF
ncbi:hypothetical protein SAMN05443575_1479 [Jatrophihabitans endophyticus]|uniref:Uncharacterized protein n=1 Tax=Jatrophihabitans endophyticus TaxID=1206085 RepID=A0A1M5HD04_9ACTN|nr:hypothetical protein [Jatrophihabitans endophyticus]SHG13807.1 hypothetical protein SAMN05443575_1479 [Jatrophihabitans endophyticus]